MIIKSAIFFITFLFSLTAYCQSAEPAKLSSARPDIPGTFTLELGFNRGLESPSDFSLGLWGSRTVNIYYQYEMRILKSKFSLVPGIGLSLERYKFRNGYTLSYGPTDNESVVLVPPAESGINGLKKSQLVTNYIDLPVELRFSTNPDDPARSFKASVGGRIGYLYDSFSKVKYREDGEVKRIKDKQNYNLNPIRYGVFAKIGVGNFSLFGYYNISPLFEDGKGFYEEDLPNNFNTFTVGISLSSF